jgi:hypothetical protein
VNTSLDWFPFGGSFRISPGVTLYNGNSLSATAMVPVGTSFTLNSVTYYSGNCPSYVAATGTCAGGYTAGTGVSGNFKLAFGNKAAPSLTLGWGNLISRNPHSHWSVPFEFGAEYIGTPLVTLNMTGTACTQGAGCGSVTTGTTLANLNAQVATFNSDISVIRAYPILKLGLGYKF